MKKKIYLISGLGADERIFQNLDFGDYEPHFLSWIPPLSKEPLKDYAARLSGGITTEKPIILGVSFGGMIASEIAKIIDCQQVIVVSSAKTYSEIPVYYRLLGWLNLHPFIPFQFLNNFPFLTNWAFGMKAPMERQLLQNILTDTDPLFLKWAVHAILTWKNDAPIQNLIHIHGTKDRVLPLKARMKVDFEVKNGEHLMIFTHAEQVNQLLKAVLI